MPFEQIVIRFVFCLRKNNKRNAYEWAMCVRRLFWGYTKQKTKNREIEKYPVDVLVYCVVTSSSKS